MSEWSICLRILKSDRQLKQTNVLTHYEITALSTLTDCMPGVRSLSYPRLTWRIAL